MTCFNLAVWGDASIPEWGEGTSIGISSAKATLPPPTSIVRSRIRFRRLTFRFTSTRQLAYNLGHNCCFYPFLFFFFLSLFILFLFFVCFCSLPIAPRFCLLWNAPLKRHVDVFFFIPPVDDNTHCFNSRPRHISHVVAVYAYRETINNTIAIPEGDPSVYALFRRRV